jgi:xyloglucan-specific exo-beta-1,4-glucanase
MGGHNLLSWDTAHNITLKGLSKGIEETSVLGLISPPTGTAHLLSVVGDIGGFIHNSFTSPPTAPFATPSYGTTTGIDFAGNKPTNVVRVGGVSGDTNPQIALSTDGGNTWFADYAAPAPSQSASMYGGTIAMSANADTLLWSTPSLGVMRSSQQSSFTTVTALPPLSIVASDKVIVFHSSCRLRVTYKKYR